MTFAVGWSAADEIDCGATFGASVRGSAALAGSTDSGSRARALFEIVVKESAVAVRIEPSTASNGNFSEGYLGGGAFRRARYRLRRAATSFRHVALSASMSTAHDSDESGGESCPSGVGNAEGIGNSLERGSMGQPQTPSDFEYIYESNTTRVTSRVQPEKINRILASVATFPCGQRRAKFTMPRQARERRRSVEAVASRISSDDPAH